MKIFSKDYLRTRLSGRVASTVTPLDWSRKGIKTVLSGREGWSETNWRFDVRENITRLSSLYHEPSWRFRLNNNNLIIQSSRSQELQLNFSSSLGPRQNSHSPPLLLSERGQVEKMSRNGSNIFHNKVFPNLKNMKEVPVKCPVSSVRWGEL